MKTFIILFLAACLLPAQVTGLREIKIGDKLPDKAELQRFKTPGNKLLLYIKSSDIKSIAFFKGLAGVIEDSKTKTDVTLYVVDAEPETDKRLTPVYDTLKVKKEIIRDTDRKIYGELGVIVIPTLLFINNDHTLHSMIAGFHSNLADFFKSYLTALSKGVPPEDVYKAAEERIRQAKITKMIKQAFLLMVNGNAELAGSMYKKAAEKDPENIDAQLGFGYSLLFSDKIDEGLAYFTELKAKNENKRVLLGYYLCQAAQSPTDDVLAKTTEFAQLEPQFFFVAYKAGEILDKAGKCEESKAVYRHAYKVLLRHHRRNK